MNLLENNIKFGQEEFFLLLAVRQKIWFLKRKAKDMKDKNFIKECKCLHCQQKLDQINNSRVYWDKLILRNKLA